MSSSCNCQLNVILAATVFPVSDHNELVAVVLIVSVGSIGKFDGLLWAC
jgi:hypothetical protein